MTRAIDRIARSAVRRHFEGLKGGRIRFVDSDGAWVTGGGESDVPDVIVRVNDSRFYRDIVLGGTLGVAESYLRGAWDCDDLTSLFRIALRDARIADATDRRFARWTAPIARIMHRLRSNTRHGSRRNIHAHYDLGNELFALFLDESMTYSCAIFPHEEATLEEAQEAKLERICTKLGLCAEDRVLEIGSGWGSFARHAAARYGCHVTTTTISREQHDLVRESVRRDGLEGRVQVLLRDYRDLVGRFDKVVSIEMIEAVGHENIGRYLHKIASLLDPRGAALVQGITLSESAFENYRRSVDFIQKYVFPGSCLVSLRHFAEQAVETAQLHVADIENIGPHYVGTLRAWRERFLQRIDDVRRLGRDERFVRTWYYYLSYCEAGFVERFIGDVQVVLAKPGWSAPRVEPLPSSPW
jgi:cyclopropane-fatty-acyl-phospholipid synthase